jgi:hypothetical protein
MRRSPRKTIKLSESVHQQLNSYALAAGAAGVSLLALAQPSEAKIVYRPTLVSIPPNTSYTVDFGLGPVPILTIRNVRVFTAHTTYNRCFDGLSVKGDVAGLSITTRGHTSRLAYALSSGATIGPQQKFQQASSVIMAELANNRYIHFHSRGRWLNVTNRYLGIRFQVSGQFHYAWARLNVRSSFPSFPFAYCQIFATLTGYAYETVPNTPIIAGKTHSADAKQPAPASLKTNTPEAATLGVLAIGAPGLSIWRREESVGALQ